jgi:hypothetical protein
MASQSGGLTWPCLVHCAVTGQHSTLHDACGDDFQSGTLSSILQKKKSPIVNSKMEVSDEVALLPPHLPRPTTPNSIRLHVLHPQPLSPATLASWRPSGMFHCRVFAPVTSFPWNSLPQMPNGFLRPTGQTQPTQRLSSPPRHIFPEQSTLHRPHPCLCAYVLPPTSIWAEVSVENTHPLRRYSVGEGTANPSKMSK